jgi:hypothetical protein
MQVKKEINEGKMEPKCMGNRTNNPKIGLKLD